MNNPLVSIGIPTYNRAESLKESLKSILNQDYLSLEILIGDDCSTDGTESLCREMAQSDSRIRYVRHPRTLGLYGNHNFCLDESRGELFCFFHDHDERDPRMISKYVSFLNGHPDVGLVCSDWNLIDPVGKRIGIRRFPCKDVTPGMQYIEESIRTARSTLAVQGTMVRRKVLGKSHLDESGPVGFADFAFWFGIAERTNVGHISEPLWSLRFEPKAQSSKSISAWLPDYRENMLRYCEEHLRRWPNHSAMVQRWPKQVQHFTFWALAYEVGLYFRKTNTTAKRKGYRDGATFFERLDYKLTREQFQDIIKQMSISKNGILEEIVFYSIKTLIRINMTWPLSFAVQYTSDGPQYPLISAVRFLN